MTGPAISTISLIVGGDNPFRCLIHDDKGAAVDLTGASAIVYIKETGSTADSAALKTFSSEDDAAGRFTTPFSNNGQVDFTITADDTDSLSGLTSLWFKIVVTLADESKRVVSAGNVSLKQV